jgi:hypothetical protein
MVACLLLRRDGVNKILVNFAAAKFISGPIPLNDA